MQTINFNVGDTIIVKEKIKEGDKTRAHLYEGIVIAIKGSGINQSFTSRTIASNNIGVERIWPINCPSIEKITVKKKNKVKKAKLYFLRNQIGKNALIVKSVKIVKATPKPNVQPKRQ